MEKMKLSAATINNIGQEIVHRGIYNLIFGTLIIIASLYVSWLLKNRNVFGLPMGLTMSTIIFGGFIIGNSIGLIRKGHMLKTR